MTEPVEEWVSGRGAARILSPLALSRVQRVLAAGLAGPTLRTSAATLHEAGRVRALAGRTELTPEEIAEACPDGLLVLRLAHRRTLDVREPWDRQVLAVQGGWPMSIWTEVLLSIERDRAAGALPVVATVCGFVAFGADLTGHIAESDRAVRLALAPAGRWYAALAERRLRTPPGKEWLLRGRTWAEVGAGAGRRHRDARLQE